MTILFILWALGVFYMFPVVLFRAFCLFKKKCSRKKCPYPFDEEEEKELNESIKELKEMIEHL